MATVPTPELPIHGELPSARLELVPDTDSPEHHPELGYTLVPSLSEKGFLSPTSITRLPLAYCPGVSKAASALTRLHIGGNSDGMWPEPEEVIVPIDGRKQLVLITEPTQQPDNQSDPIVNNILLNGLTEIAQYGSASKWHKEMALRHPDRRTITLPTPGLNYKGHGLSIADGYRRRLEQTASENLRILQRISGDGQANIVGISLGSFVAVHMAEQNLAANESAQVNLTRLKLVSPAVGARNVDEEESFRDVSDKDFVAEMEDRFVRHMAADIMRMALKHPEESAECLAILGAYALGVHKLPHRLAVIAGNFNGVKAGIEWSTIKQVASEYETSILGGELDPLVKEQIPQWQSVKKNAPRTMLWLVKGMGHAMTVNAHGTAKHLAQMEHARAA